MRKIIVLAFMTLDGVVQAPGGPEEDTANGFKFGGWTAPYGDESSGKLMMPLMTPADLLLGRKTFDIWENYWPKHADVWPGINEVTKYVFSTTRTNSNWSNCVFLNDVAQVKALKSGEGSDIKIWGSSELLQLLQQHDLVDEYWLMIHPVTLGGGKKLFGSGAIPAAFQLAQTANTNSGVIFAHYKRAGEVKTGTVGA